MGRSAAVRELERAIGRIDVRPAPHGPVASTGVRALDALLPGGGLPRGAAVEWLGPPSSGRTALLRASFDRLRAAGESVAWIDPGRTLYAPDWTSLTGGRGEFWVVRPHDDGEAAWCADLLLRSRAFGAVALELPSAPGVPPRPGRSGSELRRGTNVRLQRLAEEAGSLFVILGDVPVAALRLRFRPGRVEPVRGLAFGPFLPPVRPVWVRVGKRGDVEVPILCPAPSLPFAPRARDRKGPE